MTRPASPDPAGTAGSHLPAKKPGKKQWLWRAVPGVLTLLLVLAVWRWWQGPQLEAYAVQSRPLVQTVVATGRVANVSRVQVGSEITGVLVERKVQEGDRVQPGDVLAVLRADDLSAALKQAEAGLAQLQQSGRPQAQAALRQAEAQLSQTRREAERRRTLLDSQLIARETYELAVEAETVARAAAEKARLSAASLAAGNPDEVQARQRVAAARAALDKTLIRAQAAGTVLTRDAEPGDTIQPGRILFEIASDGPTELRVPIDEKNLEVLALAQPAQCVADAFPARPFPATVNFISPGVDAQRGSVDVRLEVDPVPDYLRQDMTVSVNIETGRRAQALVVPNDALSGADRGQGTVWRVRSGKAERTPVKLGLRGTTLTEVTSGLRAGDWVLADAGADVQEGQRVRTIPQPAGAGNDTGTNSRNDIPAKLD